MRVGRQLFIGCAAVLAMVPAVYATTTNIATPGNVLAGATAFASTEIAAAFPASRAVDDLVRFCCAADQDHGLLFSNSDPNQRLGLSARLGALNEIRIWTIPSVADGRIPSSVTVRSSLNVISGGALINNASFETALGTFPLGIGAFTGTAPNTDNTYATIFLNAPTGTRSLYLNFGGVGDGKGERIAEVQAFAPEPTSAMLVLLSASLLATARRRRSTVLSKHPHRPVHASGTRASGS